MRSDVYKFNAAKWNDKQWEEHDKDDKSVADTVFPGRKDKRKVRRANKEKYNAKHQ